MKLTYIWMAVLLTFLAACENEDPSPQEISGEEVVNLVTESLAEQEDLSLFTQAFENLEMSTKDVAEGITIFAPINEALEEYSSNGRKAGSRLNSTDSSGAELTQEELRDHIVKGVIKTSDLSDGDTLTSLSNKPLKVTADGNDIRVNGVLLSGKDVATDVNYTVHAVEKVLSNTSPQDSTEESGILEITVWNSLKWTVDKPIGEVESDITVSLYHSVEDYAQDNVAFTRETDADGKATFTDLDPEKTYWIVAEKDDMSNVFYESLEPEEGYYIGLRPLGIFQNQEEVNAAAMQSDAMPGNFQWEDLNGDGLIDNDDRSATPHTSGEVVSGETEQVEIIIGYDDNYKQRPFPSGEVALEVLEDSYRDLDSWQKDFVMLDGVLSDDADCANMPDWCEIDEFRFNANNPLFAKLWRGSYKNISQLNKLLRDVPELPFTEKDEVIAQARGLRAYIYLQLFTYFGDIPMIEGLELEEDAVNNPALEVYSQTEVDLSQAINELPAEWSSDKSYQLTSGAARALLAKASLWNQEYATAADYTDEILQSGSYQLMESDALVFADAGNAEIIWDFTFNMSSEFSNYFYGRSFCPAARLAEVYLMNAEAKFGLGDMEAGLNSLNIIRERMGMPPASSEAELDATWQTAMGREGYRFASLIRWETAGDVLSANGYADHNALLPIPQVFMDNYPGIMQNPGY